MTQQLTLPGVPLTTPQRRTRHTFARSTAAYGETRCKSCPVLRRYGPFGARGGWLHQWSADGVEWSAVEIPCAVK